MKYTIAHWFCKEPPVPDAILVKPAEGQHAAEYEIEIEDLHAFVEKHGSIILIQKHDDWFIWVTDKTGKFNQK